MKGNVTQHRKRGERPAIIDAVLRALLALADKVIQEIAGESDLDVRAEEGIAALSARTGHGRFSDLKSWLDARGIPYARRQAGAGDDVRAVEYHRPGSEPVAFLADHDGVPAVPVAAIARAAV